MVSVICYNESGSESGTYEVDESIFDEKIRMRLLKDAVLMYEANQRQGTHSTRTRAERKGSGAKPWRQKGTGRARAGTQRSPIWRGGGVVHGPKPRDYSYRMTRKALFRARGSAMRGKLLDGEVMVMNSIPVEPAKTKTVAGALGAMGLSGDKVLFVLAQADEMVWRLTRNLKGVRTRVLEEINAYDLLSSSRVVFTKSALEGFVEVYRSAGANEEVSGS